MPTSSAKFFSLFLKDRSLFTSFAWQSHSNLGKNSSQRKVLGKVAALLRGGFLLTLEFCRCDQSLELKPTFSLFDTSREFKQVENHQTHCSIYQPTGRMIPTLFARSQKGVNLFTRRHSSIKSELLFRNPMIYFLHR